VRVAIEYVNPGALEEQYGRWAKRFFRLTQIDYDGKEVTTTFMTPRNSEIVIDDVRVLVKWRHLNDNSESALDVTEVTPLELTPLNSTNTEKRWIKGASQRVVNGVKEPVERWFEASVASTVMERLLLDNEVLPFGHKTGFEKEQLRAAIFRNIYGPALEMVGVMSPRLGSNMDNGLGVKLKSTGGGTGS